MSVELGPDGLEIRGSRERTLRHPDNDRLCGCVRACMLTKAECHRFRLGCRYRHDAVRPFIPATQQGEQGADPMTPDIDQEGSQDG